MATIVKGDPKAPFSIATTPRCRKGRYSIPRIDPLYPWSLPYNAECLLYTHMCIQLYMQNTIWRNNKDGRRLLRKIYLSLYLKGCVWEGVGDQTELQHIDPHSYGHQRCVFLLLQGCSAGGPGAQPSAGCWLPLPHLVTNGSGLQTHWLPVFTELYNSSIAHSIFGMACLIVIKWK